MSTSAITVTITKVTDLPDELKIEGTIAMAAGDYVSGGFTIPFTSPKVKSSKVPSMVLLQSAAGNPQPVYVPGASRDVGKMKLWASANTEFSAGALSAAWVADAVKFVAFFQKGS